MKRKVVGLALLCLLLLAAIFAGYWDMLNTEQVRLARDRTREAIGGIAAMVDPGAPAESAPGAVPTPPASAPGAEAEAPEAPTFDILRVEPNGSTVIAGKAPAGTTVRLVDGSTTLGEAMAGPGGDFAIVLDKPLAVGEHQIRIEAFRDGGETTTSRETAIVSVPRRGRENELLAMVETPDRPSRLISVPTAGGPDAAGADAESPSELAGSVPPAVAGGEPTPARDATATAPATPGSLAASGGTLAVRDPSALGVQAGGEGAVASSSMEEPRLATGTNGSAPEARTVDGAAGRGIRSDVLAVEAVEIEDRTIYVAGRAPVGLTVRIYVDNVLLGEDADRRSDRFLVTTTSDIPPGEHMVRADQLAADGTVQARVEVPFLKPEGRAMSAVAVAVAVADAAQAGTARSATPAAGDRSEAAAAGSNPAVDDASPNAAISGPAATVGETTTWKARPDASAETGRTAAGENRREVGVPMDAGSEPGAASSGMAPDPAATTGAGLAGADEATDRRTGQAAPAAAGVAGPNEPAAGQASEAGVSNATPGSTVETARQAPLTAAGARVIIRRGDTLWRISRDTYGRGARYTTIYLANGDQIRDPDRIYPGQVFRMPDDTGDGGTTVR